MEKLLDELRASRYGKDAREQIAETLSITVVTEPKIETTQEVLQAVREQISLIADVVDTLLFAEEVTDNA